MRVQRNGDAAAYIRRPLPPAREKGAGLCPAETGPHAEEALNRAVPKHGSLASGIASLGRVWRWTAPAPALPRKRVREGPTPQAWEGGLFLSGPIKGCLGAYDLFLAFSAVVRISSTSSLAGMPLAPASAIHLSQTGLPAFSWNSLSCSSV